jgi:pimeloyl-ACP methyl ester carboxylesterase
MASVDSSTTAVQDGLAVSRIGRGEPLLVMPYPHASTVRPMDEDRLTECLAAVGRQVITFDPPGAYRSQRPMTGDLAEMLACAAEALRVAGAATPVDVVGHSMGSLCALALAIERPQLVRRLVLIGPCSGFAAVRRWSIPHNWSPWRHRQWWRAMWLGTRLMTRTGSLAAHKRLDHLVEQASFVDQRHVSALAIEPGDWRRPPPKRSAWLRHVRRVEYADRLHEVAVPTLLVAGRHDPQTPLPCATELAAGIHGAELAVFEHSGHAPFIEEPERFTDTVGRFLVPPVAEG